VVINCTGFDFNVRFPVNKDTKVTYTLSRRKWLIIEVNIIYYYNLGFSIILV